jgi:amidohydrolase
MADTGYLKQLALAALEAMRDELIQVSATLHAHPEVAFQEFKSAALLCDTLESHGFAVELGVGGLETAFRAEAQASGAGPAVALIAEYDALPALGHACGHNIIATSAVGAAVAVGHVLDQLAGRVLVIGTPAEEGGGGKIILLEQGVFRDVDAALMVHPGGKNMVARGSLASIRLTFEFTGHSAHDAVAPDEGVNALEAVIQTFNSVNALRLHLRRDARVHGIVTHGGSAANLIPDYASATFSVRAAMQVYAEEILQRVIQCAEGAALATGAKMTHSRKPCYAEVIPSPVIARLLADNWRSLGLEVRDPRATDSMGSTDMGNVTQALPAIHAHIAIAPDVAGHTPEFRAAAISPAGHAGMLNSARGMAMTVIDLLSDPSLVREARREFEARFTTSEAF